MLIPSYNVDCRLHSGRISFFFLYIYFASYFHFSISKAVFSCDSIILARVFLTRNMVSRAAGFWYQHSRISLDTWVKIYKNKTFWMSTSVITYRIIKVTHTIRHTSQPDIILGLVETNCYNIKYNSHNKWIKNVFEKLQLVMWNFFLS